MSTHVLCGIRRRKLAIKFKLGEPMPVPRTVNRYTTAAGREVGYVADGRPGGYQAGALITRPRRGGEFTKTLVRICAREGLA